MKKRCIALIAALAVVTGSFAGCGRDSDSSSSDKKASTTAASTTSSVDDDEQSNSDTSKEKTTGTTKASTTKSSGKAEELKKKTSEITKKVDISEAKGGDIVCSWKMEDEIDGYSGNIIFDENGKGSIRIDLDEEIAFDSKGSLVAGDMEIDSEDIIFDGKTIDIRTDFNIDELLGMAEEDKDKEKTSKGSGEKTSIIKLERVDGDDDEDSMDGEYKISGGTLQMLVQMFLSEELSGGGSLPELPLRIIIDDSKIGIKLNDIFDYEVDGAKVKLTPMKGFEEELEEIGAEDIYFTVEDDELTLINSDGEAIVLAGE